MKINELKNHIDEEIEIQAFVDNVRNIKWVQFIVLRDTTGKIQVTIEKSVEEETQKAALKGARFMKYENETCPVCGEKFTADSDVVVCPDCGTPHHRECYLKTNHCCNEDRHNTGFIWRPTATPTVVPEKPESKEEIPNVLPPAFSRDKMPENGIASEITIDKEGNQKLVYREIRGNERIGDKTVADYAAVIQKNVRKFIPKFMMMDKTGGKVSWNWAAFFFGPFWLAYRKMWKHAIIAMLVISIIPLVFIKDITNYYQKAMEVTTEYLTSASSGDEKSMESGNGGVSENDITRVASSYGSFIAYERNLISVGRVYKIAYGSGFFVTSYEGYAAAYYDVESDNR